MTIKWLSLIGCLLPIGISYGANLEDHTVMSHFVNPWQENLGWFIAGASVLLTGIILGVILSKFGSKRRHPHWG